MRVILSRFDLLFFRLKNIENELKSKTRPLMKSKTSPGKVSIIDSDTIFCDGLREGLIVFQLLEMGAPNSSMVKSYGRLKIFATQGYCHVFGQGSC